MSATAWRKMVVAKKIENLEPKVKKRVEKLYSVLDKVEFCFILCIKCGAQLGLLLVLALTLACTLLSKYGVCQTILKFLFEEPKMFGQIAFASVIATPLALWLTVYKWFCQRQKTKLQQVMAEDENFFTTLEKVKELDPDMARNIKKFLPKKALS